MTFCDFVFTREIRENKILAKISTKYSVYYVQHQLWQIMTGRVNSIPLGDNFKACL